MTSRQSRRQFLLYGSAAIGGSLLLKACGGSPTTSESPAASPSPTGSPSPAAAGALPQGFKAAIVLPGIISDKAWNQAGYEGINVAKEKYGIETAYVEKVEQADQVEAISDFARRGFNMIFAHGGQFDAALKQVAAEFPTTAFIGVNGAAANGQNIAALRIDHMQASYICGIIGASITKSNKLAYLAGQQFQATEEELRGFDLGAKSVKPDIQVTSSFTGDWNDAAKAKEAVEALISSGADVVFQWLDNASPTVLQAAQERGVFAFGNTADQLDVAPKSVLTSAVKRIDLAIAYMVELAAKNQLKGDTYTLGLDQPEILYLGKFGEAVPETVRNTAEETKNAILGKQIVFAPCKEGGKDTRCVKKATA
jgi:basic membrane protein A and related proteins